MGAAGAGSNAGALTEEEEAAVSGSGKTRRDRSGAVDKNDIGQLQESLFKSQIYAKDTQHQMPQIGGYSLSTIIVSLKKDTECSVKNHSERLN